MSIEKLIPHLVELKWPITVLIIFFFSRKKIFDFIKDRKVQISAGAVQIVLDRLEEKIPLTENQKEKLEGLTAHDIWALETFSENSEKRKVINMSRAQKVIAKFFIEADILKKENNAVELTELGNRILEEAKEVLR